MISPSGSTLVCERLRRGGAAALKGSWRATGVGEGTSVMIGKSPMDETVAKVREAGACIGLAIEENTLTDEPL